MIIWFTDKNEDNQVSCFRQLAICFQCRSERDICMFDVRAEGALQYLETRDSYFTVMAKWGSAVQCHYHPVVEMHDVIERYSWISQADVYQTQNWFSRASRKKCFLKGIGTCFSDLDIYRIEKYRTMSPGQVWNELKFVFKEKGFPLPSSVICSGQGLYLKWYLEKALSREMLPYWDLLQVKILEVLEDFGADPSSRDSSRVLRILGTHNQKNGGKVRVIWLNENVGEVKCYDFGFLFDAFGCSRIFREKERVRDSFESFPEKSVPLLVKEREESPELFRGLIVSYASRGHHVVSDLKKLALLRGWNESGIPDGQRDIWLFWMVNHVCLSYMTSHQPRSYHEALSEVESFVPRNWSRTKFLNKMSAVYGRVKEVSSGRKWMSFRGKIWPLFYTPSNKRLCEDLGIQDGEVEWLDYLRTEGGRSAQERRKRREAGVPSRLEIQERSCLRRKEARRLKAAGMTWEEVGKNMGVSSEAARKLGSR